MSNPVHRGRLLVASCAGMSAFGFSLVLLGTLFGFPEVRARLHVDVMKQGGLSSLLIIGTIVSTAIVGPLIDKFGNKSVLACSSFLVATAFILFSSVNSFFLAAGCAFLLGLGAGGLNTSTNALVSEVYAERRGAMLNVLAVFFGVGAITVPLIAARVSPNRAMYFAAGYAILCGVMYLTMSFPPAKEGHAFALKDALKVISCPGVPLFAVLLFFQSANEQATHTFASTWVGANGASPRIATLALMGYMAAMAVGRIAAVQMLKRVQKQNLVAASALLALAGTMTLFMARTPYGAASGVVLTALGYAAIYPTVLAIAGDRYQKFAGTLFGTLFAIALIGATISPSLSGFVGQQTTTRFATIVPFGGAAVVALLAVALRRSVNSVEKAKEATVASC